MLDTISGICVSARYEQEFKKVSNMIHELTPNTKIVRFNDVLSDISLLEDCDFIFTVGGDGSVAWLIGKFFEVYGTSKLDKLKPIVPVIRTKSVGYLKQIDFDSKKFKKGYKSIVRGEYNVLNRNVLRTEIDSKEYLAVNEINFGCAPHLGLFNVYIENNSKYHLITSTMADAALLVTPIGSTGWALSYNGQIVLAEKSLELVFAGGIHSSANFNLPCSNVKIELDLKNASIVPETVHGYEKAREKMGLKKDEDAFGTLNLVFGTRVIIDGKLIAFGIDNLFIDPSYTIPFVSLHKETPMEKARKLTRAQSVK